MLHTSLLLAAMFGAEPERPFAITVVDSKTGRGVPLIELKTVHGIRLVTDSNGVVAFQEPGLMSGSVFFHISGHGYEYPKDGFGFHGKAVEIKPGGSVTLKVNRVNIAERIYRVTGAGIYRDTLLTGGKPPVRHPLLNGQVFGQDSVINAVYRDRLYWFWGDTQRPAYPLGNFHVPGATSVLPARGGLDPDVGVDLSYWVDSKGFAKSTCEMPGKGPTWLTTAIALPDRDGRERLYGAFVKIEMPMRVYDRGLVVFNDETSQFEKLATVDMKAAVFPQGHAFRHSEGGQEYVYFAHPFPLIRVRARGDSFADPTQFEAYTCLKEKSRLEAPELDRDPDGRLRYSWRKDAPPVGPAEMAKLVSAGKMKAEESPIHLRDRDTGKPLTAHAGSVTWNEYRQRWVMIAVEQYGKSFLGEVWYAEADFPTGPWRFAVKVATHDRMSFYNPKQHPYFDKEGGRVIYFEGTYTHDFSGNPDVTPRYEYNQLAYRLDLADGRVALPRPVPGMDFLALDRATPGAIPLPAQPAKGPQFFMLPDQKDAPAATIPLFEFTKGNEKRYAATETLPGFHRSDKPVGRVWRSS